MPILGWICRFCAGSPRSRGEGRAWVLTLSYVLLAVVMFLPVGGLMAQGAATALPTLTTAHAVHQLAVKEARRGYPVSLQGVVTYYDPYIDKRRPAFFVTDASGSIFVAWAQVPEVLLKAGDVVEVTGVSSAGDFAPIVAQAKARVIGQSHLPVSAPRVNMTDLLTGEQDGQWVEVEAVVHAVRETDKNVFLDLVLRDGVLSAASVKEPGVDYSSLIDARIRLRGNQAPLFNHQGQLTGAHLLFPGRMTLQIEEPAPANPFAQPIERVSNLLRYTPNLAFRHRVHIHGTVTLLWQGRILCIQDGAQGLCAQTDQTSPLHPGETVDVIGFPMIGEFTPTLVHATYQAAAEDRKKSAGQPVSAIDALWGNHDAALVEIEGQVIGEDRVASDTTLILSDGKLIYSAILPGKTSVRGLKGLEEGSWVRLTGICALQSDGATTTDFPIARSFRILLRSTADIVVESRPSWWNAAHTLRVLACALLFTLAALFRVLILRRRIKQQSVTIRASEERFRCLATRDGLTQLPNRNAILATLASSLDAAQDSQAYVCVAILDLDHFKQINDSFGHQAGDEVLQQAALRLSFSIRNTDAIGRYGGEEFLIVFRNADQQIGMERCELIRTAICAEPVAFDSHRVPISCSIGIASTRDGSTSATALISQADRALYQAKASGRNRVECFAVQEEVAQLGPWN